MLTIVQAEDWPWLRAWGDRGFTVVEPGLRVLICTEHDFWTDIPVQLVCTYPVGDGKLAQ
jgi:hypothetical protein